MTYWSTSMFLHLLKGYFYGAGMEGWVENTEKNMVENLYVSIPVRILYIFSPFHRSKEEGTTFIFTQLSMSRTKWGMANVCVCVCLRASVKFTQVITAKFSPFHMYIYTILPFPSSFTKCFCTDSISWTFL